MNKPLLKVAMVGAAAAAALALGAGSASAAATFTVTAGNAPTGTLFAFTGVTQGASPQIEFADVTSSTTLNCASGTAPGLLTTGSGQAGTAIGSINGAKVAFAGCTGPNGLPLTVKGIGVWKLNAFTGNANGVTNGSINRITATVSDGGGLCSFKVTGNVPVSYANATSALTVKGGLSAANAKLTVSSAVGCFGLITDGDKASFAAVFKATANRAAYNPIAIKTP